MELIQGLNPWIHSMRLINGHNNADHLTSNYVNTFRKVEQRRASDSLGRRTAAIRTCFGHRAKGGERKHRHHTSQLVVFFGLNY